MVPGLSRVRISFPRHAPVLLDSLNHLRLQGKFCDVAVHAGGRVFAAHSSVLAAASPFFHDKLLLHAGPRLVLPPAVDAGTFEGLLELIYCGRLNVAAEALSSHLLVASALQMWHVVERCSQILRELEGDGAGQGCGGASARKVHGHDESLSSSPSRNVHSHDGSSSSWNVCDGHESIHGLDKSSSSSSSSSKAIHGNDGSVRGLDGSSKSIRGLDGSVRGLDGSSKSIRGLDGSSKAICGPEGSSSSSLWVKHGHEGSPSSSSSKAIHGCEGSLSSWNVHDGDESIHGLDGSIHGRDGSSRAIRGPDGSLPSSSSSRTVRVREGSSSVWSVRDEDESIRGLDGAIHGLDGSSSSSKAIHAHDGSLPSSSSSSRTNHGHEESSLSSRPIHGREGSPWSLSRAICSPNGSSRANCGGERSSSSFSLLTLRGSAAAPRLNHGEGASSLSMWGSHGGEGTIHDDIRTIHDDRETIHGDSRTTHGDDGIIHDNETIHRDIVTVYSDNDPSSSSWATRATTEDLLQLRVATTTSPSPQSEEILKICVEDDDDDNDDNDNDDNYEGTTRIVLDNTTAALAMPPDPPAIFYIKPEPDTAVVTTPDIPALTNSTPPGWMPLDLHGNELPRRGGQPVHAPVKLGAAPADGKRFGCACGKRFAARPKRDRHIRLTLSLRPFPCGRCHKRFKLKHHLREHMRTHDGTRGHGRRGQSAASDQYGLVWTGMDQCWAGQ